VDHQRSNVLDLRFSTIRYEQPGMTQLGLRPGSTRFSSSFVSQLTTPSFPRITGFAGDFGSAQRELIRAIRITPCPPP